MYVCKFHSSVLRLPLKNVGVPLFVEGETEVQKGGVSQVGVKLKCKS